MSFCRWSSDNYRCDVYVYEHYTGGFMTHVAGRRYTADTPIPELPDRWWEAPVEELMAAMDAQRAWLDSATLVPIGLPHDGETFCDHDAEACVQRLLDLRAMGYRVPEHAIDALRAEIQSQPVVQHLPADDSEGGLI